MVSYFIRKCYVQERQGVNNARCEYVSYVYNCKSVV